jgi:hypothetical protein
MKASITSNGTQLTLVLTATSSLVGARIAAATDSPY